MKFPFEDPPIIVSIVENDSKTNLNTDPAFSIAQTNIASKLIKTNRSFKKEQRIYKDLKNAE